MSASPPAPPSVDYAPAPSGWYPDPAHAGGRRYWDGHGWTDQTSAAEQARPGIGAGLAVGGYVSALLIPILGLILGLVANRKHNGVGTNHGAGIIALAAASFLVNLALVFG
jgi:hypothetical protein